MRVLFINQFYVPDIAATGQLLADVAEELSCRGHEVHVLCSRRTYNGGGPALAGEERINGVHVHRVLATGFGRGRMFGRAFDYASFYLLALWNVFVLPRMDVCVTLTTPPFIALVGLLLHRLWGTRIVIWTMDLYPEVAVAFGVLKQRSILRRILASLSRRVYHSSGAIISLGQVMTERLVEAGAPQEKITVIHNWVPRETINVAGPAVP
jgi:colanic acid biosynthesis glycosyl transferase WcaI